MFLKFSPKFNAESYRTISYNRRMRVVVSCPTCTKNLEWYLCAGTTLALISLLVGITLHSYPSPIHLPFTKVSTLKLKITYLLLVSMSVTYLAEAGYKIYTYQAIFIANPCHCLCLVQIFILYRWYNQQVNNGNSKEPDMMLIYTFRYV